MTNLVDDVAREIWGELVNDDEEEAAHAARAAIAVFEKWLDEKCPEVAHIVKARINAQEG